MVSLRIFPIVFIVFILMDVHVKCNQQELNINLATQRTELKATSDELEMSHVMPTRIGGTRWVGHMLLAIRCLLKGYKAITVHMRKVAGTHSQSAAQSKAKNYMTKLKSKNIILFSHFLVDVLSVLSRLSKQLQEREASVFKVHQQLETTLTNLKKLGESYYFGDDCLSVIVDHYRDILEKNSVDLAAAEEEWTFLKQTLYDSNQIHESKLSWAAINNLYKDRCPNLLEVIDLVMSLPSATAECERGFSQVKLTKTKYRNKLRSSSMTLLMTIQLHAKSVDDFDPGLAIHKWNRFHHRRPDFIPKTKRSDAVVIQQHQTESDDVAEMPAPLDDKDASSDPLDSDYESEFSDLEGSDLSDFSE